MITILDRRTETERSWTIRDDNRQEFFGDIPLDQPRINLTLNWKKDSNDSPIEIGRYCVDLPALVHAGLARTSDRGFHLRFQRTDNLIEVAQKRSSGAVTIGSIPKTTQLQ